MARDYKITIGHSGPCWLMPNADFVALPEPQAAPAQIARILPDHQAAAWLQRIEALDNLLALHSLNRSEVLYGGGFVVTHPSAPNLSRWIDPNSSEESWLEDVKLLER